MKERSIIAKMNSMKFDELTQEQSSDLLLAPLAYLPPIFPSNRKIPYQQQAQAQAISDWNRNMGHYFIGDKSISALREGAKFSSIEELNHFIISHLLIGMPTDEHRTMLEQSILHLHQGGILHSANIAIHQQLTNGFERPVPSFKFKVTLFPLETGIGFQESLKLSELYLPKSEEILLTSENPETLFLDVEHYSKLELAPGYGNVSAATLKTTINASEFIKEQLSITEHLNLQEPQASAEQQTSGLTSYLSKITSLLRVLWRSGSAETVDSRELEQAYIKTIDMVLEKNKTLYHGETEEINGQSRLLFQLNQKNAETFQQLSDASHQLSPANKTFNQCQQALLKLKTVYSEPVNVDHSPVQISHAQIVIDDYLPELERKIELLKHQQQAIKPVASQAIQHQLQRHIDQLQTKAKHVEWLAKTLATPNLYKDEFVSNIAKQHQSFSQQAQQLFDILNETIEQESLYHSMLSAHISLTEEQQQQLDKRTERLVQLSSQQDALSASIEKLNLDFKQNRFQQPQYASDRKSIIEQLQVVEFDALQLQRFYTDTTINELIGQTYALKSLIAAQSQQSKTLTQQLTKLLANINNLYDKSIERSQAYQEPEAFLTDVDMPQRLTDAIDAAYQQSFKQLKEKVVNDLEPYYNSPFPNRILNEVWSSSIWAKHNQPRAQAFVEESIAQSTSFSDLYQTLYREHKSASQEVVNRQGQYCLLLKKLTEHVASFLTEKQLDDIHHQQQQQVAPSSPTLAF